MAITKWLIYGPVRCHERKAPPQRGKFILEGKIKMKCTNTNRGSRQF